MLVNPFPLPALIHQGSSAHMAAATRDVRRLGRVHIVGESGARVGEDTRTISTQVRTYWTDLRTVRDTRSRFSRPRGVETYADLARGMCGR
jgi:hypothetical protein